MNKQFTEEAFRNEWLSLKTAVRNALWYKREHATMYSKKTGTAYVYLMETQAYLQALVDSEIISREMKEKLYTMVEDNMLDL